ncbi:MAG: ATP synthase F1 subunit delta [Erysipelotrichaceae bacterium]
MASLAVTTYGSALFDLSVELDQMEAIKHDFQQVVDTCYQERDFVKILQSPRIKKEEKKELFRQLFAGQIETTLLHFLLLLIDKNRIGQLRAIFEGFIRCYNEANQIEVATVWSATALSTQDQAKLIAMLEQKTKKKIELVCKVDPRLIAGIRLKVKDEVMDNTILNRLNNMKKQVISPK